MNPVYRVALLVCFLFLAVSCKSKLQGTVAKNTALKIQPNPESQIATGAANFEAYLPLLRYKKVGVVTNSSGIVPVFDAEINQTQPLSIVDFLIMKKAVVQKIFAPEHGFRGTADAGEQVIDGKDTQTGVDIVSLYGNNKKPKPEQLAGLDVIVFDIQDVGVRFYTYLSTLHYVMEACAENQIPLLVLDQPNPNGSVIDGPVLELPYSSFVGMHPVPILYGMTIGEYAQMINGEKWLKNEVQCSLTVIPCLNYSRELSYSLPVRPSPNLPNDVSVNLYASLCLFEGTAVSVGRGTEKQFQVYGAPFLPNKEFSFVPMPNLGAKKPLYEGETCFGEDLSAVPKVHQLELKWLMTTYRETANKASFFNSFFTKLAGTKQLQTAIEQGLPEKKIRKTWKPNLEAFLKIRQKYLLYPDVRKIHF